jgi:hypothetical protein
MSCLTQLFCLQCPLPAACSSCPSQANLVQSSLDAAVMSWEFCPLCPFQAHLSRPVRPPSQDFPVPAVLSRLFCYDCLSRMFCPSVLSHGCLIPVVPFRLSSSYPGCNIPSVCSSCSVPALLSRLSYLSCPVRAVWSPLLRPSCPVPAVCTSCPVLAVSSECPFLAVLSQLSCPSCPVPAVLSKLSCPIYPVFSCFA